MIRDIPKNKSKFDYVKNPWISDTFWDMRFNKWIIEKKDEGIIKISFRSKGDFKVNIFASRYFNGGGHEYASGGVSKLSLIETEEKFIVDIKQYLKENYE